MFANTYKKELLDAVLEQIWKQWTSLGVSGQINEKGNFFVLDPEALLLFSSFFARFDQRLYDLIIDWLQLNGEMINIPRLKALLKRSSGADKNSLAFISGAVKIKKWNIFSESLHPAKTDRAVPLFLSVDGISDHFIPHPDPSALSCGFERNQYVPGNKVVCFPDGTPGSLLLRLRGAFGLSARAEAILALLNKEFCKISDVADCGGFSWKTARDVLEELTRSGLVVTLDDSKRGRDYFLKNAPLMRTLFGIETLIFPDWTSVFNAISKVYQVFNNPNLNDVSEKTVLNELQNAFAGVLNGGLHFCGIPSLARLTPEEIMKLPQVIRMLN